MPRKRASGKPKEQVAVSVSQTESDDVTFVHRVHRIIMGILSEHEPHDVFIVHIDNWFGNNWLGFAGKTVGGWVSVHDAEKLRIPPFHPNRVFSEQSYRCDPRQSRYVADESAEPLLRYLIPEENVRRKERLVQSVSKSGLFAWYSGQTRQNTNGSMMVYISLKDGAYGWHVQFEKVGDWKVQKVVGITRQELSRLELEATKSGTVKNSE